MTGPLLNRRSFLTKTGLLVAGSALGSPLVGCSEYDLTIPCLGPAAAPAPVAGMTYIRASQIGCALDCDLGNGHNKNTGGAATDDGPRINAAMAGASASNPITLIIDGSAMISGLFLPAGGYWSIAGLGCGTGFYVKTGTNNDGIHNGPPNAAIPFDPGPPVPARGKNVSLSNFTLNGNQGEGRNGNSTTGMVQGTSAVWDCGINLMNLDNITIENVVVVNTPAYHCRLSNVGNVTVTGCVLRTLGVNTDGLHFDGPANDITISNCDITSGDDAIAFNCPEGHGGDISRVSVSNCTVNAISLMRLDTIVYNGSPNRFNIDTVTVSNCSGTGSLTGFWIGDGAGANPNSITNVTISNCNLRAPAMLDVGANFGNITLNNVTLSPYNSIEPPGFAFLRTSKFLKDGTYVGSNLTLNNCVINRDRNVDFAGFIIESGSAINNLALNGFSLIDAGSYSPARDLLQFPLGSIGQVVINTVESSHILSAASASGFANITTVSGTGVLATGWKFPDAVMANGVPYISANSGLPSIKINGLVELYGG
jgi:hypothetical protein